MNNNSKDIYFAQEQETQRKFANREADWRFGGIVYQIFVDRFAPSAQLDKKRHLYSAPRTLQPWDSLPQRGVKDPKTRYWTHELAFWGGDLASILTKMDYLKSLNVNTIYLNPIFSAFSNHKYDTYDYEKVSPEYGDLNDLQRLIYQLKQFGMHLILDGVFNHMAIESPRFLEATKPNSPERDWFVFGKQFPTGFRLWHNVASLPELNLANSKVRGYLFNDADSIVKRYLKMGISGWRLDTAIELGYHYLHELTQAAHEIKAQSVVIGELNNYPSGWAPAMDGTMLFPVRDLIIQMVKGKLSPRNFAHNLERMIQETGIDTMLKSWILLENHDTTRIATEIQDWQDYQTAKILQFTLPGTVNLYMGEEIGIPGGDDPLNRAPMNWKLVEKGNRFAELHHQLIQLRQQQRALRIGDIKWITSDQLIAYIRYTENIQDLVVVIVNSTNTLVKEMLLVPDPLLKSHNRFTDLLTGKHVFSSFGILLPVEIAAKSSLVLKPNLEMVNGYTPYKNIQPIG